MPPQESQPQDLDRLPRSGSRFGAARKARLTPREAQVLRHIALGLSNNEIRLSLGVSIDTVKEHVQQVLYKLGVTDRTQAAVWAVKAGVI